MMKVLFTACTLLLAAMMLSACGDGTAENAGERIDETMTDVGNKIEDACEKAKENLNAENDNC